MKECQIVELIGKAIREGRYLSITYRNKEGEVTPFWISILDINDKDELRVNMFNVTKDEPIYDAKIFISSIQNAEILRFSQYDVSRQLLEKIENDRSLDKYNFNTYNHNLLSYYLECFRANHDPFLHKAHLIPKIDLEEICKQNTYQLSDQQQKHILSEIYRNKYDKFCDYELALSEFSIDITSKGKFVVVFRRMTFDPVQKVVRVDSQASYNPSFYLENVKHSLSYYLDVSPDDFRAMYEKDSIEAIEMLKGSFRSGELPNTRPEIVVLGYPQIDISDVYNEINSSISERRLEEPMKAFFEHASLVERKKRTREPIIVLCDRNINLDQLRTVYNSIKYPVTYVQGPPGTGKTQTILNIVVNCLMNDKTLLISSNNNVPIDGIMQRLDIGEYKNKKILLPCIRLGNSARVVEAMKKIRDLYEYETKDKPIDNYLSNLKRISKENNKLLLDKLKKYEDRMEVLQNFEFIDGLLNQGSYYLLNNERERLEKWLMQLPEISEESIIGIFEIIKDNYNLCQYFYFNSLKFVNRLKANEYSDLIEIAYKSDEKLQVSAFNKWISVDANMELFTKVFPVVLTTNISSRKLGKRFKFDVLTIDEAGQCDIATSLIPLSKCKNMVLIGDTNQLKPIVLLDRNKNGHLKKKFGIADIYDYAQNSTLSVFKNVDNISNDILLRHHYRCAHKIIDYSNMRFYERKLNLDAINRTGEVNLISVNNLNHKGKNSQIEEAKTIVQYIIDNHLDDVFIITPFRNQDEVIKHYLSEAKSKGLIDVSVHSGTIHKVQGQENKTVIISTAISCDTNSRTYDWIKDNSQLINVAVTRARDRLIVVADRKAIDVLSKKDDDLYALIDYVEKNGSSKVMESSMSKLSIGYSNNSQFEDEFYKTMQHFCSVKGGRFDRNVKLVRLFPEERNNILGNNFEFDGVLFMWNQPKVVFEIDGHEHYHSKPIIEKDRLKMDLLCKKDIHVIKIPNQYVKHYEFIGQLIRKIKGEPYETSLFDGYDNVTNFIN